MSPVIEPSARDRLPLAALLSHALVAYVIELDNEFEHRMTHRTTRETATRERASAARGPWLVSVAMYFGFMRFVAEQEMTLGELERRAGFPPVLHGMRRWGYAKVEYATASPGPSAIVRSTAAGREAAAVWSELFAVIDNRWRERFGAARMSGLRAALEPLVIALDPALPDFLPVLGYGLAIPALIQPAEPVQKEVSDLLFVTLLARPLLAMGTDFEAKGDVSIAIAANVLRVMERPIRVRDIPTASGISKEAVAMALGWLEKRGLSEVESDGPARIARLTDAGQDARRGYFLRLSEIEERWRDRYGAETIDRVRARLEDLVFGESRGPSPLFGGLDPYPDGWRAGVPRPRTLPHFPAVLHRGGYPDGS